MLDDAKAFSNHACKKTIDSEDIKMAIKSKVDYSFTTTPPRDVNKMNFFILYYLREINFIYLYSY